MTHLEPVLADGRFSEGDPEETVELPAVDGLHDDATHLPGADGNFGLVPGDEL